MPGGKAVQRPITSCTRISSPGDTSAGPSPTTVARASARGFPSARASAPAATHTERLNPHAQQTKVGTRARTQIEALLGTPVYLDLHVKIAKDWQRDPRQLRKLGF